MSSLRHWLERWAWVPIPGLLVAILALRVLDWQTAYESQLLLILLNFLFSAPAAVLVAILAGRSFLARGTPALLLLGCGTLVWGAAGTVGPALLSQGVNVTISIHNLLVWLAALCHLASAALSVTTGRVVRWRRLSLTAAYTVVAAVVGLVTLLVLAGWTPVFFVQGQGGTPVRQAVLGLAVLLFALAPLLLWVGDQRVPTPFARWYGLALWLLSTGLFGVMIEVVHGGVVSWAGRTAPFLGGAYLLMAAIVSKRESGTWRRALFTALEEARETAREHEERFQSFFELSADLVCIADLAGFCSACSNACTAPTSSRAPASAWPMSAASSRATAVGPGPRALSMGGPPSTSPCNRPICPPPAARSQVRQVAERVAEVHAFREPYDVEFAADSASRG